MKTKERLEFEREQIALLQRIRFDTLGKAKKMEEANPIDLAAYPWDKCIADQIKQYGDEETAKKVCGAIKAMYGEKQELDKKDSIDLPEINSFAIPEPNAGEKKDAYIKRCMEALKDENKPEDQKLAICYAQLKK